MRVNVRMNVSVKTNDRENVRIRYESEPFRVNVRMSVSVKTKMRVRMSAFAPTLTLIFVAPSGIEPEFRASETLVLSVEL